MSVTPRAGGVAMRLAGDRLTVYRRQPDGRWLLARDAHTLVVVGDVGARGARGVRRAPCDEPPPASFYPQDRGYGDPSGLVLTGPTTLKGVTMSQSRADSPISRGLACLLAALALDLAAVVPAAARITVAPWSGNFAFAGSRSRAGGMADSMTITAPSAAVFSGTALSSVENDTTGANAFATMNLATSFTDSTLAAISSGFGSAEGAGADNQGGALVFVQFVVERTQSWVGYPVYAEGNFGPRTMYAFIGNSLAQDIAMIPLLPGETATGRLAPGIYFYYYLNTYGPSAGAGSPNSASSQVAFLEVADPFVTQHPTNQTVPAGSTASFSVSASGSAPGALEGAMALTYQWRRNFVDLANGGRISGATSNTLQISNVAHADSGLYDCVVTNGPVTEPCSAALLRVTSGTTGVPEPGAGRGVSLARPTPNPFGSRTRVEFTLVSESRVSVELYDLGGRRVRVLSAGAALPAGAHTLEWDGQGDTGEAAPSGVYFVRLMAGGESRVQRVVRMAR